MDPALLNARGVPNFNVKFYVVNAAGECAGVALYGGDARALRRVHRKRRGATPVRSADR